MRVSNVLKHVRSLMNARGANADSESKIIIPYGRHSYGPQPQILGFMPWTLRKSYGSRVGNFCSISPGVKFSFLGKHNYHWVSTYPFYDFYNKWQVEDAVWHKGLPDEDKIEPKPIIIENDVWIATNVTIKEGVTIGNGAVVGMEALVTKDVPSYALVGGNPARIIKFRFNEEQIDELLRIAWWNWNDEKIRKFAPLLISSDIDKFIREAKNHI